MCIRDSDITSRESKLAAKAGFELAVTTQWGYTTAESDRYMLPRFTPWDSQRFTYGMRLIRNLLAPASLQATVS
jgi:hypothetical protein